MEKANLNNLSKRKSKIIMVDDYKVTAVFNNYKNTEISAIIKSALIDSLLNQRQNANLPKQ